MHPRKNVAWRRARAAIGAALDGSVLAGLKRPIFELYGYFGCVCTDVAWQSWCMRGGDAFTSEVWSVKPRNNQLFLIERGVEEQVLGVNTASPSHSK